jgi:hypothetical protein
MLPIDFDKLDEDVQNMISQLEIDVMDLKHEAWLWRIAAVIAIILLVDRLARLDQGFGWLVGSLIAVLVLWQGYRKYRSWCFRHSVKRVTDMFGVKNPFDC